MHCDTDRDKEEEELLSCGCYSTECGLSSQRTTCFELNVLSNPFVHTLCFKDPPKRDDAIYPELLTVEGGRFDDVTRVLTNQRQEKFSIKN